MLYDRVVRGPIYCLLYKRSKPALPGLEGKVRLILDVGCGTGFSTRELAKMGETIGLDRERRFLRSAKASGVDNLVCGDALHLPFKEDTFDLICMYDLIHHLKEPEKALAEAKKMLKKRGYFFLKDVKKCRNKEYYLNELADWFQFIAYRCPLGRYFSEEEWTGLLRDFNTIEFSSLKNEVFFLGERLGFEALSYARQPPRI